jgi:type II secretion system protein G
LEENLVMLISQAAPARNLQAQRGFTLVELMVVVAIIALLAAIVIPNYIHARAQASVSQSEANLKQIATSLELYYADQQTYPGGQDNAVTPAMFGGAGNPYLAATPTNALGRESYHYSYVAASAGKPASYSLTDPGTYDPSTLSSLANGPGSGALCAQACTHINYDPQDGLFGS